jgi:hypothetical protein
MAVHQVIDYSKFQTPNASIPPPKLGQQSVGNIYTQFHSCSFIPFHEQACYNALGPRLELFNVSQDKPCVP